MRKPLVPQEGIWGLIGQLAHRVAGLAVWEWARAVSLVVNCHGHGVENDGQAVSFLRRFDERRGRQRSQQRGP